MTKEKREGYLNLRIKPSVKAKAVKLAAEDDRSITSLIERLIEQEWDRRK